MVYSARACVQYPGFKHYTTENRPTDGLATSAQIVPAAHETNPTVIGTYVGGGSPGSVGGRPRSISAFQAGATAPGPPEPLVGGLARRVEGGDGPCP